MVRNKQTLGDRSQAIQAGTALDNAAEDLDFNESVIPAAPAIDTQTLDKANPPAGVEVQTRVQQTWRAPATTGSTPAGFQPQTQGSGRPSIADALTEFLEQYDDGDFYSMQITREADPMLKRAPNATYARPCLVNEILGSIPFTRASFIEDLRALNGNSGGSFHVQLFDNDNQYVDSWRGNVGDPVGAQSTALAIRNNNELEKPRTLIDTLREQAEMLTLMRTITGASATPQLSEQDQAMKSLMGHPEIIGAFMGSITTAITAATTAATNAGTPKAEGVKEMALQAIFSDSKLQERLINTAMRAIDVLGDVVVPNRPHRNPTDHADNADSEETETPDAPDTPDNEAEVIILTYLTNECAEGREVTADHQIFADYKEAQPTRHTMLMLGLKTMPPQAIVDMICKRADEYNQGAMARLVWNRPEALRWIEVLKQSLK